MRNRNASLMLLSSWLTSQKKMVGAIGILGFIDVFHTSMHKIDQSAVQRHTLFSAEMVVLHVGNRILGTLL